jgi:hypothetical protein
MGSVSNRWFIPTLTCFSVIAVNRSHNMLAQEILFPEAEPLLLRVLEVKDLTRRGVEYLSRME